MPEVKVMKHGKLVQIPATAPLVVEIGMRGLPGGRGPKGDCFKFEDLTPEQKNELKGEKGDKGDTAEAPVAGVSDIDNLF